MQSHISQYITQWIILACLSLWLSLEKLQGKIGFFKLLQKTEKLDLLHNEF